MVPSPDELEAALIDGTYHVFASDPDATTVNKVRKHAEEENGLDEGFFTSVEWKQKSKVLIKKYVEKLLDGWTPESKTKPKSENGIKRQAPEKEEEDEESSPKRRLKSDKNSKARSKSRGGNQAVKSSKETNKLVSSREYQLTDSDQETDSKRTHQVPLEVDTEDAPKEAALSSNKINSSKSPVDEEDDYSDVIDEPSRPRQKKKGTKHEPSKSTKPATKKSTVISADDPQEAEIKKFQSQLVKCGVRKLWHNELKQYGDDSRAKVRHLKQMLNDVGMDGRFSEAKAREIKEMRELLADVDAAQEMNALWGKDSGRRANRSKQKLMKLNNSDESDVETGPPKNVDHDDKDDETTSFAARRRRAQADLAFLGDDSGSD